MGGQQPKYPSVQRQCRQDCSHLVSQIVRRFTLRARSLASPCIKRRHTLFIYFPPSDRYSQSPANAIHSQFIPVAFLPLAARRNLPCRYDIGTGQLAVELAPTELSVEATAYSAHGVIQRGRIPPSPLPAHLRRPPFRIYGSLILSMRSR